MSRFILISKKNCQRCRLIKEWFKSIDFPYEEWLLEDPQIWNKVMKMENFQQSTTKNENGNTRILTPILYNDETGQIYSKQLFGLNGIRKRFIESIIGHDSD